MTMNAGISLWKDGGNAGPNISYADATSTGRSTRCLRDGGQYGRGAAVSSAARPRHEEGPRTPSTWRPSGSTSCSTRSPPRRAAPTGLPHRHARDRAGPGGLQEEVLDDLNRICREKGQTPLVHAATSKEHHNKREVVVYGRRRFQGHRGFRTPALLVPLVLSWRTSARSLRRERYVIPETKNPEMGLK